MDKKEALFLHSKRRGRERYGFRMNDDNHSWIVEKIKHIANRHPKNYPGKKITCRKFFISLKVPWMNEIVHLLYDRKRECIITFLTEPQAISKGFIRKEK